MCCCYVLKDEDLIRISGKTKAFKYEFLSAYIPLWNEIIFGKERKRRALIDTHAGTGRVLYHGETIYGSCGLFLEKTVLQQHGLDYYFIEKDFSHYRMLQKNVRSMCEEGFKFPIEYKNTTKGFEKNGLLFERKEIEKKARVAYPNKDQINILNGDCVEVIGHVLKQVDGAPAFFFIDPCGVFEWKLIKKIVKKRLLDKNGKNNGNGNGKQKTNEKPFPATELFINFSWEAISRNKNKEKSRDNFFQQFFGMSYAEVQREVSKAKKKREQKGKRYFEYNLYVDVYKSNLRKYFDYVTEMSIIGVKSEKNPVYVLIFCSNNEIAKNLYEEKEAELNNTKRQFQSIRSMKNDKRNYTYQDYKEFLKAQRSMCDFF
ncbi:MAG: hypothetical protein BAJALOKI1v1_410012 [Promethearchaeota archaeon]|nr:MAG: hypothetical protein BAJALOKI1v1_410012 [Candidatus Lokiarchaeota archaeon]